MNAHVVTIFHSGRDLKEDAPDELIVPEVHLMLRDHRKEVSIRTKVEHDEDEVGFLYNAVEGDNSGMVGGELMESNLPTLKLPLPGVESCLGETLDGVPCGLIGWGRGIEGKVDDSVRSLSENGDELISTSSDTLSGEISCGGVELLRHSVERMFDAGWATDKLD